MSANFETHKVPCCVCGETGKVRSYYFWTRDCNVCDGTGQRPILIGSNFSLEDRKRAIFNATYPSLGMFATLERHR